MKFTTILYIWRYRRFVNRKNNYNIYIEAERGKSYGKRLLETAINFLNSKNVQEICLIVITRNTLAYNIYKKRGFEEKQLISDWFVINEG